MPHKKPVIILLILAAAAFAARETNLFPLLSSTIPLGKQKDGFYLLPTNQMLRPWGQQTPIKGRPVDLAFNSDKRLVAVLNTRTVLLFDALSGAQVAEIQTRTTSYTGVAFRPGDRELWTSETSRNGPDSIAIETLSEWGVPEKTDRIELTGHPVPCGIAFSPDGSTAYVAMSRLNQLAVIDVATRTIRQSVDVGNAPFAVMLLPKHGKILVTNRGGRRAGANDTTAPSSGTEVVTDPVTGSTTTGTVSVIDIKS